MSSRSFLTLTSIIAAALAVGGCATGAPGSARRICHDSGLHPGTQAFTDCWQRIADRDFQDGAEAMAAGAYVGAAASGSLAPPSAASSYPTVRGRVVRHLLRREWFAPSTDRMCEYANGTVLNVGAGSCPASVAG